MRDDPSGEVDKLALQGDLDAARIARGLSYFAARDYQHVNCANAGLATSWTRTSQTVHELVGRQFCLTQQSCKRPNPDFVVHRHHTALRATPHDDVTAGLANLYEAETLKGFDNCRT